MARTGGTGPRHERLVFWCEERGIVITGDALWQNGVGAMFPTPSLDAAISAAHETLDRIAALTPRWVIPGHGDPFPDVNEAIARGRRRLDSFARDPKKNAWHVLKSLFSFVLLAKQQMRLEDVPTYVESVPAYRDLNDRFIGVSLLELANQLVNELVNAKVAVIDGESIKPILVA